MGWCCRPGSFRFLIRRGRLSGDGRRGCGTGFRSAIVWAISPRHDTLPHLVRRVGQFAVEYLRTASLPCALDLPEHPERTLSAEVRHNLLCAVKEALTNTVRHSHAKEVRLSVEVGRESLAITIEDDGRGFVPPPADPNADGLRNMRQRMAEIGGEMSLESAPGAGTRVRLFLPWDGRG